MNEVPQFRCRSLCPVLTRSLGGEKINWHSILRVHRYGSIHFTQVGHSVVNIKANSSWFFQQCRVLSRRLPSMRVSKWTVVELGRANKVPHARVWGITSKMDALPHCICDDFLSAIAFMYVHEWIPPEN
jgi:hypothetical protein